MLMRSGIHRDSTAFFLAAILVCILFDSSAQALQDRRFAAGFSFGGYPVHQRDVSTCFQVVGYRSVGAAFDESFDPAAVSSAASVAVAFPGSAVILDYCPKNHLGLRLEFAGSVTAERNFTNVNHADPVNDRLRLNIRSTSSNVLAFYRVLPYKARRKVGVELTTSAGISVCSVKEMVDVRFPVADTAAGLPAVVGNSTLRHGGVSALFGFDAVLRIGPRFSFMPARILWGLSVLHPSFDELRFVSGSDRRILPARNYDLSGLFWQVGAFYHF